MTRRGGLLLTWCLGVLIVAMALVTVLRWVDATGVVPIVQSFFPITGIGAVLVLALVLLARRWRLAVPSGLLVAVFVALAIPTLVPRTVEAGDGDLVVMSANLEFGQADPVAIVNAVKEHQVDALVLLEVTADAVERLRAAGLEAALPHAVGRPQPGPGGTVIRSASPLTLVDAGLGTDGDVQLPAGRPFDEPVVRLRTTGGDVILRAAHPFPPLPTGTDDWRRGVADLTTWREQQPSDSPVVLAGDFNASTAHPAFRELADTMTDAHQAAGSGWVRTWPQGRRLIPPFVQLDHVLARGLGVVDAGVIQLPGSDHAAVWARWSVPERP